MWIDPRTGEPSGVYGSGKAPAPSEDELLYLGASAPASTNPLHDTYEAIKRAPIFQPLLAFSFISNIKKLFGRPASEDMPVLNGIRVLSLFWVIMGSLDRSIICHYSHALSLSLLSTDTPRDGAAAPVGHTYIGVFSTPLMNAQITLDILQRFRFQVLYGGFFAVDSFFLMSGFLVAYLFIGQVRKVPITREFDISSPCCSRLTHCHVILCSMASSLGPCRFTISTDSGVCCQALLSVRLKLVSS